MEKRKSSSAEGNTREKRARLEQHKDYAEKVSGDIEKRRYLCATAAIYRRELFLKNKNQ